MIAHRRNFKFAAMAAMAALAIAVVFLILGTQANRQSKLTVIANGMMVDIPLDDDMFREEELAWGPGGFLSSNPGAAEHLEALREGNRAYNRQFIYFGTSGVAGLAALCILFAGWRTKPDNRDGVAN